MAKVIDKATAFKNEISGSTTNKIVCKVASHEVAGPKKKHVDCEYIEIRPSLPAKGWVGVYRSAKGRKFGYSRLSFI